jgi:hypothetical protein
MARFVLLGKLAVSQESTHKSELHCLKARLLKMGAASLAYLPMLVLLLAKLSGAPICRPVLIGCVIFNFPAISLLMLIQTYHVSWMVEALSGMALLLSWSSLIAWFFWRAVGTFQGDDEPDERRGQYDWAGFQVRFVIGFVIGALCGWRFVAHTMSMKTLLVASITTGCIGGFVYGLCRPPDFWSRP